MTMPLRTRLFAAIAQRAMRPIEQAQDFDAFRAQRLRVQRSVVGRALFGAASTKVNVGHVDLPGSQRAVVYRPRDLGAGPLPCVVNFHGGGWVQGNPEQSGWFASRVAEQAGVVVISPTYSLAPERPFPAAVLDAWSALRWVAEQHEQLGIDPQRIAVMGDSAGGNLAAVVALLARDHSGPHLRAQILIYPAVDMYQHWPSETRNAQAPILTSANMSAFAHLYLGEQYGTDDPRASPIRAQSHAGLPPAMILTAEFDPLADNGMHYRNVLQAAGVDVLYRYYGGAIHGFVSLPHVAPAAREALDDVAGYVRTALAANSPRSL